MHFKLSQLSAFLILSAASASSLAQDIEQITVTASPSESALLSVERNLSVISQEQLQLIEHEHINQAIVRVPGGWISRGNGQEHLTAIRSPVLTGAGGCGAFFMAQDGISLRAPSFCNTNQLFDANTEQAQRIEVLRGPSSVAYGSNAVHGVINVITPDAFTHNNNSIGASFGANDYFRANFSLGKTFESTANGQHAVLVYGNGASDGGYKDESGFDQQKINVIHQYQNEQWSVKNVLAATNLNQETAGFIKGEEAYKDGSLKKQNPNPEAYRDSQSFRAYSEIDFQLNEQTLLSFTPYVRFTDMEFLQHYLPWQPVEENSQKGIGFKFKVARDFNHLGYDFTWYAGLDGDFTEGSLTETQLTPFAPTLPQGEHYDYTVDTSVISPYSQVKWAVSDKLGLTAGVRFDMTRFDYQNHLATGSACEPDVDNCRFTRPDDQDVDFDEFSYQLGGHYLVADNHSLYGQLSTGYRAPQATELFRLQAGQTVADLEAEKLVSLELGIRGQWEALFYDVTAFTMEKEHFIFQDANRQNISNGETSHHGVELSVHYQLASNFYIQANGTVANHRYDNALTLRRENIKGNEIDTAPQHMGSVQFGWQSEAQDTVELEWSHMGNYYLNPENTAEYAGHNLLNLRMATTLGNKWRLSARVLNLTDEDYAERADFGFGSYRYFVGEPRSIFVSVKYDFN